MRSRKQIVFYAFLLAYVIALPLMAAPPDHANNQKTVTVMTRNVYLGADLAPAIAAVVGGDPMEIIAGVSEVWGTVQFTDFRARAAGLAGEIEEAQPDLIGLQEAELWRSQTPSDILQGNPVPNADHVEYDFVQILIEALSAKGLHYAVVRTETGVDVEAPGFLSAADAESFTVSDIRLTEREVILTRTDLKTSELKLSNPQGGHFANNVEYPVGEGSLVVLRSWVSVDAKVRGKSFRFLSTHLEADDPEIRNLQAMEVICGPANTNLPVVLAADANSNANGDSGSTLYDSAAYDLFIGHGFTDTWFEAHPGDLVSTCCNAPNLTNDVFPLPADDEGRIDLLLYRGPHDFSTLGADLFGTSPADRVSNGLVLIWPSDHAGMAARLLIQN
jgi:endonuclease/exonuclease/phosphatase family metal-dependent hydrolase